jgi:hypothetical protein
MLPGVPVLGRNFVPLKRRQFPVGPPSTLPSSLSLLKIPSGDVLPVSLLGARLKGEPRYRASLTWFDYQKTFR